MIRHIIVRQDCPLYPSVKYSRNGHPTPRARHAAVRHAAPDREPPRESPGQRPRTPPRSGAGAPRGDVVLPAAVSARAPVGGPGRCGGCADPRGVVVVGAASRGAYLAVAGAQAGSVLVTVGCAARGRQTGGAGSARPTRSPPTLRSPG